MSEFTGALGEVLAARYLRDKGLDILSANYRSRFGEIDIVAADGDKIIFVEVKTRTGVPLTEPREAVHAEKQRRLSMAAAQYLRNEPPDTLSRFDVIEVYLDEDGKLQKLNHIPDAFRT